MHCPILRQDQHDERGADKVEHDLDREHNDPATREAMDAVAAGRERRQRHRKEEGGAVQHGNEDRRPAADEGLASLEPQFARSQDGVAGDDGGAYDDRDAADPARSD